MVSPKMRVHIWINFMASLSVAKPNAPVQARWACAPRSGLAPHYTTRRSRMRVCIGGEDYEVTAGGRCLIWRSERTCRGRRL